MVACYEVFYFRSWSEYIHHKRDIMAMHSMAMESNEDDGDDDDEDEGFMPCRCGAAFDLSRGRRRRRAYQRH